MVGIGFGRKVSLWVTFSGVIQLILILLISSDLLIYHLWFHLRSFLFEYILVLVVKSKI